jgi:hypothetical protein
MNRAWMSMACLALAATLAAEGDATEVGPVADGAAAPREHARKPLSTAPLAPVRVLTVSKGSYCQ